MSLPGIDFLHSHAELKVKTVKYFKSIERVQDEVEAMHAKLKDDPAEPEQIGSME